MRFSTRTLYGLRAVLALASRYGEGSLPVSQISRKEGIPAAYLEQILNALKRKGLVKSVRGPQGGYMLAKKPADVSLRDLLTLLVEKTSFFAKDSVSPPAVEADDTAIANYLFWKHFKGILDQGLGKSTLKDLMDEARQSRKTRRPAMTNFQI